jgi:hypothetical protein
MDSGAFMLGAGDYCLLLFGFTLLGMLIMRKPPY